VLDLDADLALRVVTVGVVGVGDQLDQAADDVTLHGVAGVLLERPRAVRHAMCSHVAS
jgi:hypothetical protein